MTTQSQNPTDSLDAHLELAFRVPGSRQMYLKSDAQPEKIDAYFCHHIIRQPQNLLVHVQRIHFALKALPGNAVYSALLDLFIALGARGRSLRADMLQQTKAHLSSVQLEYFNGKLESGLSARDLIPDPGLSMLSEGHTGRSDMVLAERLERDRNESPLQQAMECIECSDLDGARVLLESAVRNDRSDSEQQKLLMEIYRKTDDRHHFSSLYETIDVGSDPLSAEWQALHDHFEQVS